MINTADNITARIHYKLAPQLRLGICPVRSHKGAGQGAFCSCLHYGDCECIHLFFKPTLVLPSSKQINKHALISNFSALVVGKVQL